jgi:hypothetical protein
MRAAVGHVMVGKQVFWVGLDDRRMENVTVQFAAGGLEAQGVQLGSDPVPYRANYRLKTGADWGTKELEVSIVAEGWSRWLTLHRSSSGQWDGEWSMEGQALLASPGGDLKTMSDAVDCDLGRSPITNTPPIRRFGLHVGAGSADIVAAWVAIPSLQIRVAKQTYAHDALTTTGATIAYSARPGGYQGLLNVDTDGLITTYPGLARRLLSSEHEVK